MESVLVLHMVTISGKYHVLSRALRYLFLFSTCQFLSRYPYVESVLVLELKKSGHNFDKQSVDNFGDHIWNRQILLVYISKNEENRKTLWITAHEPANPTTHPDNLAHSALAVCYFLLDTEGRNMRSWLKLLPYLLGRLHRYQRLLYMPRTKIWILVLSIGNLSLFDQNLKIYLSTQLWGTLLLD